MNDDLLENFSARENFGTDKIWRFPENPSHCIAVREIDSLQMYVVWYGEIDISGCMENPDGTGISPDQMFKVNSSDLIKAILRLIKVKRPIPKK